MPGKTERHREDGPTVVDVRGVDRAGLLFEHELFV